MPISIKANPTSVTTKNPRPIPAAYKKIAEGMERQFLQYMLEKMKETTGSETKDSATKYYKSLMNSEHAKVMAKKNEGLGIQEMILKQIYPGYQQNQMRPNPGPKQVVKAYSKGIEL